MIKYIASDLDGTILKNGAQSPDPVLFDLISKLNKKGIRFIAASGRQYQSMRKMFEPVKDEMSYIAENGSLCIHEGKVVSTGLIDRDLSLRIFREAQKFPGCDFMVSCEKKMYTDSKNPKFIHFLRDILNYEVEQVSDVCEIREPFIKIAICDFEGHDRILSHFRPMFKAEIDVVTSGNIWIDFIAPNANKGTALAHLCSHLGFPMEDGISFGDEYNDKELLEMAGIGYAMIPCAPGVEKYADRRAASVMDVMAEILRTDEMQDFCSNERNERNDHRG